MSVHMNLFPTPSVREGNGDPLQCSCLENPMDGGVWYATVHGVARVKHDLVTKPPLVSTRWVRAAIHLAWIWLLFLYDSDMYFKIRIYLHVIKYIGIIPFWASLSSVEDTFITMKSHLSLLAKKYCRLQKNKKFFFFNLFLLVGG